MIEDFQGDLLHFPCATGVAPEIGMQATAKKPSLEMSLGNNLKRLPSIRCPSLLLVLETGSGGGKCQLQPLTNLDLAFHAFHL